MRKGIAYDLLTFLLEKSKVVKEDILNLCKEFFYLLITKQVEKQQEEYS